MNNNSTLAIHRFNGIILILSALGIAVVGWLALSLLSANIREDPEIFRDVPPSAFQIMNHRAWLAALAIPPAICGAYLLTSRCTRGRFWLAFILGTLWLFSLLALVLYSFIRFITPLYQYRPL